MFTLKKIARKGLIPCRRHDMETVVALLDDFCDDSTGHK